MRILSRGADCLEYNRMKQKMRLTAQGLSLSRQSQLLLCGLLPTQQLQFEMFQNLRIHKQRHRMTLFR